MLPALERCSVILSRFAGIARFRGSNDATRFSTQQINVMIDSVACIHLISSKILIQVVDELELFTSFSAWLRYEIDRLASGSTSTSDDAVEKEAAIDHSKVLLYLQKMMTTNPLSIFFPDSKSEPENGDSHANHGFPLFDLLTKQLEKQERRLPYIKSLLRIDILCTSLTHQADAIFSQIANAEKRNVLFGKALDIGTPESYCPVEMKICKLVRSARNLRKLC
jgi:anaphase-promoting complex subunit 4